MHVSPVHPPCLQAQPRDVKYQRVRQRFMHKLKYYVDKYDNGIQCVGSMDDVSASVR
ncbi:MAG: hypothetical protein R2860_16935 [Desulfobacterales bacterium]